jgi:predicted MFS family arabinose efflux permease
LGTLIAPLFGLAGDRLGHRNVLCAMRAVYSTIAALVAVLSATHLLNPLMVFAIAAVSGLIRPSDLAMRNALVAETMPGDRLMGAMGVARTTSDSARVVGALAGAGLFAAIGMAAAYGVITMFYVSGFLLTLGVGARRPRRTGTSAPAQGRSLLRDLWEGMRYVADTPQSLAAMWLAFLVNMTAFPFTSGLLPYVAREIYHINQTGLGTLVSSFAIGALLGSVGVSIAGRALPPARMMIGFAFAWYGLLLVFALMPGPIAGRIMLALAGCAQSLSMVPMAVMLLHSASAQYRGRVMGVRMLAIYGLPIGLMVAGTLIERVGFVPTVSAYCTVGLAATLFITLRWRTALWPSDAPGNAR